MAHIRCETCKGRKMMMGLGYMTHKCRVCKGVGFIAAIEPVEDSEIEPEIVVTACSMPDSIDEPVKRKYARKSKVVADE